jgi:lipid A ethanolaminephosphotransferase
MSSRRFALCSLPRPQVHVETVVLATAVYLMVVANGPFWRAALAGRDWMAGASWLFAGAVFVALCALYFAFGVAVSNRYTVKPVLSALLLAGAACAYFMDRYGIYFDGAMLRNVLATDPREAAELLGWRMLLDIAVFGLLPALLVWWLRLKPRPLGRALAHRLGWFLLAIGVAVGSLLLVLADFASLMRNHKEVRHLITPGNVVAALASTTFGRSARAAGVKAPVGADARLGPAWQARSRPALFVLVVGETARAQNFGLNGYARQTSPELARRDVVNFPHVQACGTSTEVSLPCMFSAVGRRRYDEDRILGQESVLHVLDRAGFQVQWRDNQSGCKGVCAGLPQQRLDQAGAGQPCAGTGQCLDEVLLQGLEGIARDAHGNLFVVLHQLGSHGPAYFKRYPPEFRRFTPACESEDLRTCSDAEIVNAYDNSLLYTDFVLGRLIDLLERAQATHDTALLYVSDHGESLGEGGLYLHGMPYAIAPDVQKHVPLVMWLSPAFRRDFGIDLGCLRAGAAVPASHDNLFHSLLGVLDVRTSAYEVPLDLFAPCRVAPVLEASAPAPDLTH